MARTMNMLDRHSERSEESFLSKDPSSHWTQDDMNK